MSLHAQTKKALVAVSAALAMMLPAGYALVADSEAGVGAINRFAYATGEDLVQTTSNVFVPMPDMQATFFVRPADRLLPMMINWTGATNTLGGPGSMRIQVRVDGVALPFADDLQLSADALRQPYAFTWVAPNMTPGFHTVEVFWKHITQGGTALVQDRCLVVQGH